MTAVVFTGPTLPAHEAVALLPAIVLPPARQGDVWRAVRAHRPTAIGLIDGVFRHEPAVWHREILWALGEGVTMFGAASMGALRAAELSAFGMVGIGRVFEAFRDGVWPGFGEAFEDDDEVAVTHAPEAIGAMALSDAMVDLRDTLLAAEAAGLLARPERDALAATLKARAFPDRSCAALLDAAQRQLGPARASVLREWLPSGRVARKRLDAIAMLRALAAWLADDPPPFAPAFRFENAQVWDDFVRSQSAEPSEAEALVLSELRLRPQEWRTTAQAGLGRLTALAGAPAPEMASERHAYDRFRANRGLARGADLAAWREANAASPRKLADLLRDEAAIAEELACAPEGLDRAIADQLRLDGRFAPLLSRARAKQAALAKLAMPAAGPELDGAQAWFAEQAGADAAVTWRNATSFREAVWREYVFSRREPS